MFSKTSGLLSILILSIYYSLYQFSSNALRADWWMIFSLSIFILIIVLAVMFVDHDNYESQSKRKKTLEILFILGLPIILNFVFLLETNISEKYTKIKEFKIDENNSILLYSESGRISKYISNFNMDFDNILGELTSNEGNSCFQKEYIDNNSGISEFYRIKCFPKDFDTNQLIKI